MPRLCTVCGSPDRQAIDEAIVSGESFRVIARRWGVSKDAAMRHRAHVSAALAVVRERREARGAETLVDRIEQLYGRAMAILDAAETEGRASIALAAVRELRGVVELLGKLTGEINSAPTTNVVNVIASAEWYAIRGVVLDALAEHPEVRAHIAARLLELEAAS